MKRILVPLTTIALAVLVSACGSEKTPVATTAETEAALTETVKKDKETETGAETTELRGENVLKEALRQRLDSCIRITGTAGASLKTVHQAVRFLQLANDGDYTLNIVSPVVLEYYASLSDTDKVSFLETWKGIDGYTNKILYDFYSVSNILEDAGDLDSAKQLVNSAAIKEKWERMRKGITAVLPDEIPEIEESESAAGTKTEERKETTFETDKYGYHILGTDAYGTTIYDTDENGNLISENAEVKLTIDEQGRVILLPENKEKESETEAETTETEEIVSFSGPMTSGETQKETQQETYQETTQYVETETTAVFEIIPGYPTGGPDAVIFSDFH